MLFLKYVLLVAGCFIVTASASAIDFDELFEPRQVFVDKDYELILNHQARSLHGSFPSGRISNTNGRGTSDAYGTCNTVTRILHVNANQDPPHGSFPSGRNRIPMDVVPVYAHAHATRNTDFTRKRQSRSPHGSFHRDVYRIPMDVALTNEFKDVRDLRQVFVDKDYRLLRTTTAQPAVLRHPRSAHGSFPSGRISNTNGRGTSDAYAHATRNTDFTRKRQSRSPHSSFPSGRISNTNGRGSSDAYAHATRNTDFTRKRQSRSPNGSFPSGRISNTNGRGSSDAYAHATRNTDFTRKRF
ncbi:hypothetical protein DOY81_009376 [Sarcophaga bullata]|nr:hypothetical protein DOY81_009376 [Sarcophaga bullata]